MKKTIATFVVLMMTTQWVSAQTKDILWLRGKTMVSGEISKVSPDAVSVKTSGKNREIAVDQIDRISFGDDPTGLASVRSSVKSGQLEQAKTQLGSVKSEGRPFVKQEIAFFQAAIEAKLALRGQGSVNDAARLVGGFLKSSPNSFRYYEACEAMGDLAMSLGRFDSAVKYYEKLAGSKSRGVAAQGSLLLGDAWLLKGDAKKAEAMFQRCVKATDPRLKAIGQLGVASCAIKSNKVGAETIAMIEKVIEDYDSSDVELFARAYNALGEAYLAAGKTESALDAYLHTDLLFYRDSEKHAEALFQLAKLWTAVNKPSEASRAKKTLKQRYPTSVWARR